MLDTDVNSMSASSIVSPDAIFRQVPVNLINFYINSPGGSVTPGMSIYDTILQFKSPNIQL